MYYVINKSVKYVFSEVFNKEANNLMRRVLRIDCCWYCWRDWSIWLDKGCGNQSGVQRCAGWWPGQCTNNPSSCIGHINQVHTWTITKILKYITKVALLNRCFNISDIRMWLVCVYPRCPGAWSPWNQDSSPAKIYTLSSFQSVQAGRYSFHFQLPVCPGR